MRPFFLPTRDLLGSQPALRSEVRFAIVSLYAIAGMAIFCILSFALLRSDMHRLLDWVAGHAIGLFGGLFLLTYGLLALLRPDIVLRWIGSAYSDYDFNQRSPSAQHFVRGIGVFVAALSLIILKNL